ncbi:MAG: cation transporter [Rhodovibrio sp.]|nr:cation transporter [Rhodovibrio sp.]
MVNPVPAMQNDRIVLEIAGLSCGGCADKTRRALETVEGVAAVTVDHQAGRAEITAEAGASPAPEDLLGAVRAAGYTAKSAHQPHSAQIDLPVFGMSCGGCAAKVQRELEALDAGRGGRGGSHPGARDRHSSERRAAGERAGGRGGARRFQRDAAGC